MFEEVVIENIKGRFIDIKNRMTEAIKQLNDEDLNWRPTSGSNSITNLVVHISGNIHQRVEAGIEGKKDIRDRESEFSEKITHTKKELLQIIEQWFSTIIRVITSLSQDGFLKIETIRNNEVTNLDVIMKCASHFSEHLGQILYIAKIRKGDAYVSTSIPRKQR
ncbi:DinB family protein [Bacillus gobiensis]|uniref:DinB family protein n=1 Tax=Bacillus gobiensis TaxID=1441095 RepID=UPI003D1CACA7